jgi:hypothetical protein
MKKLLVAAFAVACTGLVACTSIETATVSSAEIVANGGEAVAVVQAEALGLTAIFHIVDIVSSDLDQVVNKLLVSEAKAMGGSKIDLKSAMTTPRHGLFALGGGIIGVPISMAGGIVVK